MADSRTKKIVGVVYYALAATYACYAWYSYSGLYRILAEAQLRWFHEYEIKLTFALELLILMLPLGLLGPQGMRGWYRQGMAGMSTGAVEDLPAARRRQGKVAIVLGLLLIPLGYAAAQVVVRIWKVEPLTTLDLKNGDQPASAYLEISGIVLTKAVVHYTEDMYGKKEWVVAPMVAPDWDGKSPVRFFIHTVSNRAFVRTGGAVPGRPAFASLDRKEPPFELTYRFVAERDGLPGMVREQYKRGGFPIAEPHYMLEDKAPADTQTAYYVCIGIGIAGGLIGVMTGLGLIVGAKGLEMRTRRQ